MKDEEKKMEDGKYRMKDEEDMLYQKSYRKMNTIKTNSKRFYVLRSTFYVFLASPLFAGAQTIRVFDTPNKNLNFTRLANKLSDIANYVIPFLIGVAFVVIIWGIFRYVRSAGDTEQVAKARLYVIYGIIALFLMLSFWGFVMIISNSLFGD